MLAAADGQPIPTREEMQRALEARHGVEVQRRFSEASVAVCGLGGLGSNIAISLARAGVGRLHLIDFDRVDITNLHRQQYSVGQLGQYKTKAMKETLFAIAPYVEVTTDTVRMTENHLELLRDDGIIVEAFDNPEAKAMLVNGVLERYPEKYMVAGSGMAGMDSGNRIVTRRVTDRFYLCGDGESDVAAGRGLLAPRVMLCAAHEALTVLRILAGELDV
ncbi:thiamine biosynthesis protein ThiF [Dysosmobacter sp.]|uniref:thiamine biosynthesis protein ThiF n=1 Tax=Dysosmobacter sp. TaxID=2591382 RepID=UPI002A8A8C9D|nr:thiamine biosynthesis protein ThiF [Dysosmobacter sp.]MDY3281917.1 thiamine biosynthesis protein ThiF [Dysosmobacter sp.]